MPTRTPPRPPAPHTPIATLGLLGLLGLLSLVVLGAAPCAAQEQFRGQTWNRATGNAGFRLGTDGLNLGLGARAGYTLGMGVYLGANFDYYLGDSEENGSQERSSTAWTLTAEGGYDFGVADQLVLRPFMGMGLATASVERCLAGACESRSDSDFQLAFGGQALYFIGDILVGGEVRVLLAGIEALVLGVNIGYAL